jgi:large subunit ribosomal protein L9
MLKNLNILLLKDVNNLGYMGDIVKAKAGYIRNFLYPNGFCILILRNNILSIKNKQKIIKKNKEIAIKNALLLKKRLLLKKIFIKSKSGKSGKLFGSITSKDIESYLKNIGYKISSKNIKLLFPIKILGEHVISINAGNKVNFDLKINIISDDI